jgi:hypothetical protein
MTLRLLLEGKRVGENITDGVKVGLMFSAAFSLIALVIFVLSGGAAFDRSSGILIRVIAAYVVGGIASGAVFGLLRPLARWAIGAAVLGVIVMAPAYAGMRFAVQGFAPWTMEDTSTVLTLAGIVGSMSGIVLRHRLIKRGLWTPGNSYINRR